MKFHEFVMSKLDILLISLMHLNKYQIAQKTVLRISGPSPASVKMLELPI